MNCCCIDIRDASENKHVVLTFKREELLYDIKNLGWVESDMMDDAAQHGKHLTADIGEDGNVDEVYRLLALYHAAAREMLYPFTKREVVEEEVDDRLMTPSEYIICMNVPKEFSRTTVHFLAQLIHNWMVFMVLAHWLGITKPDAAAGWRAKADETKDEIEEAKSSRRKVLTRKLNPF